MHLTNDAVQKDMPHYGTFEVNNKMSMSELQVMLGSQVRSASMSSGTRPSVQRFRGETSSLIDCFPERLRSKHSLVDTVFRTRVSSCISTGSSEKTIFMDWRVRAIRVRGFAWKGTCAAGGSGWQERKLGR